MSAEGDQVKPTEAQIQNMCRCMSKRGCVQPSRPSGCAPGWPCPLRMTTQRRHRRSTEASRSSNKNVSDVLHRFSRSTVNHRHTCSHCFSLSACECCLRRPSLHTPLLVPKCNPYNVGRFSFSGTIFAPLFLSVSHCSTQTVKSPCSLLLIPPIPIPIPSLVPSSQ